MSQQSILPEEGSHFITLEQAIGMTTLYREERENVLGTGYKGGDILPVCETFHRSAIDTLLAKEGCEGFRVYFGMDLTLKVRVLLVAVNEEGEDMVPEPSSVGPTDVQEDIVEEGHRCPPSCPPESPLNS